MFANDRRPFSILGNTIKHFILTKNAQQLTWKTSRRKTPTFTPKMKCFETEIGIPDCDGCNLPKRSVLREQLELLSLITINNICGTEGQNESTRLDKTNQLRGRQ